MTATPYHTDFTRVPYLPGCNLQEYLDICQAQYPALYQRLDLDRLPIDTWASLYSGLDPLSVAFESKEKGGRGDAYRSTQLKHPLIRARGIKRLFELALSRNAVSDPAYCILDMLGGNGTLTRTMRTLCPVATCPTIFTGDLAAAMVCDALAQGLPAIRQPAHCTLFGDGTLDGVIFAYGTHHIPPLERPLAVAEAYRVLRPGGRVVVQDFEEGTPTARWYSEVLDRYTRTGHKHTHFTRSELHDLLVNAGFAQVDIQYVYDPCIFYGATIEEARVGLLNYLVSLFALEKLLPMDEQLDQRFWQQVEEVFAPYATFTTDQLPIHGPTTRQLTVVQDGDRFRAELPRVALVAVGER